MMGIVIPYIAKQSRGRCWNFRGTLAIRKSFPAYIHSSFPPLDRANHEIFSEWKFYLITVNVFLEKYCHSYMVAQFVGHPTNFCLYSHGYLIFLAWLLYTIILTLVIIIFIGFIIAMVLLSSVREWILKQFIFLM